MQAAQILTIFELEQRPCNKQAVLHLEVVSLRRLPEALEALLLWRKFPDLSTTAFLGPSATDLSIVIDISQIVCQLAFCPLQAGILCAEPLFVMTGLAKVSWAPANESIAAALRRPDSDLPIF